VKSTKGVTVIVNLQVGSRLSRLEGGHEPEKKAQKLFFTLLKLLWMILAGSLFSIQVSSKSIKCTFVKQPEIFVNDYFHAASTFFIIRFTTGAAFEWFFGYIQRFNF